MRPLLQVAALLLVSTIAGCTPRLSLPFRDYESSSEITDSEALNRVEAALLEAGWQLTAPPVENSLRTERRTLSRWGIYDVTAYVEVVPLGGDFVRIFYHPYREFITGGQSKIPYVAGNLKRQLVNRLDESLREHGLFQPGLRPIEKLDEEIH